jgi:hypothetical protein
VSAESSRVEELAGRLTDGAVIDWDAVERQSETPDERETIRGLRLLATIADAQAPQEPTPGPGSKWGSLEIVEPIARGGFGDVWRARDPGLDREVALKLLDQRSSRGRSATRTSSPPTAPRSTPGESGSGWSSSGAKPSPIVSAITVRSARMRRR